VTAALSIAAGSVSFRDEMRTLYERLDAEIAARSPVCTNRGQCCKFDQYGHRLYVTPAEMAYFAAGKDRGEGDAILPLPEREGWGKGEHHISLPQISPPFQGGAGEVASTSAEPLATTAGCPYQIDGRCTARTHRPIGCRIFFCDPDAQDWQPELYERFLDALKKIGAAHDLPYRYVEWRVALREIVTPPSAATRLDR